MSDHSSFVSLAKRLIDKNGRTLHLITKVKSNDSYNATISESQQDIVGVNISFTKEQVASGLVEVNDTLYLVDSSVDINQSMQIIDDRKLSIVDVKRTKLGDQTIMFKVHCRG